MDLVRYSSDYSNECEKFILSKKDYSQQYNKLYISRLYNAIPAIRSQVIYKWGEGVTVLTNLIDIENSQRKNDYVLLGLIVKLIVLRGSILDEFRENAILTSLQQKDITCDLIAGIALYKRLI